MKKQYLKTVILATALAGPLNAMGQVATPTHTIQQTFTIPSPDYKLSPYTGMTRQSWIDAAEYLLSGAFTYIRTLDDPMYFPKQLDKTYPNNEGQVPTAKLEGFCRTLFVAPAPGKAGTHFKRDKSGGLLPPPTSEPHPSGQSELHPSP